MPDEPLTSPPAARWPGAEPPSLVLVRHGRTAWNVEGRFLGRSDVPLDEVGRAEADRLGRAYAGRFATVVSSPAVRALATARPLGTEPIVAAGLSEVDQGELEGLAVPLAMARFPSFFRAWEADPSSVRIPGGESLVEARDRMLETLLHTVHAAHPGPVAIVTHQLVAASVLCTLAGEPLAQWRRFKLPHAATVALRWERGSLTIAGPVVPLPGDGPSGV